ncbi:MAG TPA: hypothetical protein VLX28_22490, partial [Thermoanaerobaculia bacterium]|nr:hypothetical protein [Thermoanaerobaculia bacterium]
MNELSASPKLRNLPLRLLVPLGALAAGDGLSRQDLRWPARAGALAVVLVPIAWQPDFGVVVAVCGLALAWPRAGLVLAVLAAAGLEIVFKRP